MASYDIVELPSTGRKWWVSNDLIKSLERNHEPKNAWGEFYYNLKLSEDLTLQVCYRRSSFITVEGVGGYVGLSWHDDGWHIGTPAFAISQPLIDAMEKLRSEQLH